MEIYINILRSAGGTVVAACDKEVLGRTFSEGDLQLEVKEDFYCGELKDLLAVLRDATMANFSGNRVVGYAVSQGLIDEKSVLVIGGIKHAQLVLM